MWPFSTSKYSLADAVAAELADGDDDPLPSADTFPGELRDDPRGYGYAALVACGDDTGIAELLNQVRDEIRIKVRAAPRSIIKVLAARSKFRALKTAADGGNEAAWNTWEVLQHRAFLDGVDLFDPISRAMLTGLVDTGVLSPDDREAIEAVGLRAGSRAEELSYAGVIVSRDDVAGMR